MSSLAHSQGCVLRVSLLQQCQYDCAYCRPGAGLGPLTNASRLSVEEYRRLARAFRGVDVRKVRFTGGEPLLHPHIVEVVRAFREGLPSAHLALTTNGQRLRGLMGPLAEAGLSGATVHVDSLDPERYRRVMGPGELGQILATVVEAKQVFAEVKLNVVVQAGVNDDELWGFLEWSRAQAVEVRFIELMNTGSARAYTRRAFFAGRQILERVGERGAVTPLPRRSPADPAALYRAANGVRFGIIASDTEPFCADCNRLRLSADGQLRGCLYQPEGVGLGQVLRAGGGDEALSGLVEAALSQKRSHHPLRPDVPRAAFSMADTGG